MIDKLVSIDGIGEKSAREIAEEYDNLDDIKRAIMNGDFRVGGISSTKLNLLLKL